jgi:hypothetical protein
MKMAKLIKIIVSVSLILFVITSCGYREGVLQKEPVSYLWFTGNVDRAMVSIDGGQPFALQTSAIAQDSSSGSSEAKFIHYKLSPGKHRITVQRDGQIIVDRVLILENENTREIQVP